MAAIISSRLLILLFSLSLLRGTIGPSSLLDGVTLHIIPKESAGMLAITRNEQGFIVDIDGVLPQLIDWLSQRFNFNYEYLQAIASHTDDSKTYGRGVIGYITSGEADVALGENPMISLYFKRVDFSAVWTETPAGFLIPIPEATDNLAAIIKPFQYEVWVGLFVSIIVATAVLYGLGVAVKRINVSSANNDDNGFSTLENSFKYIIRLICNQGGAVGSGRWLAIRILVGTWCLACFILITAYSSVLTSFIVSPNLKPVIDSIEDIPKVPGLQVVIDKESTLYKSLATLTNGTSKYKTLADQWKTHPELQCYPTTQCLDMVRSSKPGATYIYLNMMNTMIELMIKDHNTSGKCSFTIAKKPSSYGKMALYLTKHSPYTEYFNRGILELRQYGFLKHWESQYLPQQEACSLKYNEQPNNPRISLVNLGGPFVLLAVGLSLAFLVFLLEKIVYYHKLNRAIAIANRTKK